MNSQLFRAILLFVTGLVCSVIVAKQVSFINGLGFMDMVMVLILVLHIVEDIVKKEEGGKK